MPAWGGNELQTPGADQTRNAHPDAYKRFAAMKEISLKPDG